MANLSKSALRLSIEAIDQSIRKGQHSEAKKQLSSLAASSLPRESLVEVAALARRLSLPLLGLRLLYPVVRPPERTIVKATALEKSEYGALLIRIGAVSEALSILKEVAPEDDPNSLLYRSFAYASRWDYQKVVSVLSQYLELPKVPDYQRLIGKVNLAQGLVYLEDNEEASRVLKELLQETEAAGAQLLRANSLELLAHVEISRRYWRKAEAHLEEAAALLGASETIDRYLVEKERAILALYRSPIRDSTPIEEARAEAVRRKHWESVRDCDFNLAVAKRDRNLAERVYWGTPYPAYRERLERHFEGLGDDRYVWQIGEVAKKAASKTPLEAIEVDLQTGQASSSTLRMKPHQVPHRLILLAAEDFYRPKRPMELFSRLFPDEHYSPKFSGDRFHQAVARLRAHLEAANIPLTLAERSGFYSLEPTSKKTLRLLIPYLDRDSTLTELSLRSKEALRKFLEIHPCTDFSRSEFSQSLGLSSRTARRLISELKRMEALTETGAGPYIRYRSREATKIRTKFTRE